MITLYYSPGACSLAPHILLRELDAEFELNRVLLANRENYTVAYRKINPACRVPVLQEGAFILTEVPAILAHLVTAHGGAAFVPNDSQQRARAFEVAAWLSTTVHIAYAQFWRPERFVSQEIHYPDVMERGEQLIPKHYELIERRLSSSDFIAGPQFSFADAYLFVFYRWGGRIGLNMKEQYPNWTKWSKLLLKRPAVRDAMDAEGITLFGIVQQ